LRLGKNQRTGSSYNFHPENTEKGGQEGTRPPRFLKAGGMKIRQAGPSAKFQRGEKLILGQKRNRTAEEELGEMNPTGQILYAAVVVRRKGKSGRNK